MVIKKWVKMELLVYYKQQLSGDAGNRTLRLVYLSSLIFSITYNFSII